MSTSKPAIKQKGMSLIEVIVGAAIIGSALVSIIGVYSGLTQLSYRNTARVQAAMLLEEGREALISMRDFGWTANIASKTDGTTYRFIFSTSTNSWSLSSAIGTTTAPIDGVFDRTVVLSSVYRDGTFAVTPTPGALDVGTKKATITVSWFDRTATSTQSLETYIYNSFTN